MAHLVDEDQRDEADPEPPAAEQCVGADRDDHRAGDGHELQLVEDRAELGQERARGGERAERGGRADAAAGGSSGATTR